VRQQPPGRRNELSDTPAAVLLLEKPYLLFIIEE